MGDVSREDEVLGWLRALDAERARSAGVGMPCCTMVALWLLAMRDGVPAGVLTYQRAIDWGARVRLPHVVADWWARANVWTTIGAPWSSLDAAQAATDGHYIAVRLVSASLPAPSLTPGRWHVIQRYRDPSLAFTRPEKAGGHTYLVRAGLTSVDPVTVVQSSEGKRLRVSAGSWDGTAGLTGLHVGAVVLPSLGAA